MTEAAAAAKGWSRSRIYIHYRLTCWMDVVSLSARRRVVRSLPVCSTGTPRPYYTIRPFVLTSALSRSLGCSNHTSTRFTPNITNNHIPLYYSIPPITTIYCNVMSNNQSIYYHHNVLYAFNSIGSLTFERQSLILGIIDFDCRSLAGQTRKCRRTWTGYSFRYIVRIVRIKYTPSQFLWYLRWRIISL